VPHKIATFLLDPSIEILSASMGYTPTPPTGTILPVFRFNTHTIFSMLFADMTNFCYSSPIAWVTRTQENAIDVGLLHDLGDGILY